MFIAKRSLNASPSSVRSGMGSIVYAAAKTSFMPLLTELGEAPGSRDYKHGAPNGAFRVGA